MKKLPWQVNGKASLEGLPTRGGFSMVELLVVSAILSVLVAVMLPTLRVARAKSNAVRCMSNLRVIGTAMNLYLAEHNGIFPPCVDYVSWRGTNRDETDADIAYVLNDYIGAANGTHKNNMDSKVWECPTAVKFAWRANPPGTWSGVWPPSNNPYYLGAYDKGLIAGAPDTVYAPHNITYRYNSKLTRGVRSMDNNVESYGSKGDKSEHPQYISRLKSPGKAALMWDLPDELGKPNFSSIWDFRYKYHWQLHLHGEGINCLFVDGHVEQISVAFNPVNGQGVDAPGTLWWFASEQPGKGWDGAVWDYYYNIMTGLGY